ncbi:stilbene synthase [Paenibacillus swuensis]|uniref:Stilbene synthase n=1 Tax=Paenibacillus swuensis TaxID=1178515 RepID=A0A172TNB3_9BACL|nr:methyltransferase domain-containing protein [Paenibacillus swuensis]ANE48579.1 stilbene synthase [Paenibacillus swuensis]
MFSLLKKRSTLEEYMDQLDQGGPELTEALRHLRRLNRIFAAAGPTIYGIERLWEASGKPTELTVLDIGAGSGDVNRRLLTWADTKGVQVQITLMDITEEACAEAVRYYSNEPRIQVVQGDLFRISGKDTADIVTATQFLHHFTGDTLTQALRCMHRASRIGVVINDIHRHWISWSAVWLMTRLVSRNRYIQHDGPLSVAKGFRAADWNRLADSCHDEVLLTYKWRPLFRYAVICQSVSAEGESVHVPTR